MRWLSRFRWWRERRVKTGTLAGNPSALDDILEEGPLFDTSGTPLLALYAVEKAAAVKADLARDLGSAFDDLEAAEHRRRDALSHKPPAYGSMGATRQDARTA